VRPGGHPDGLVDLGDFEPFGEVRAFCESKDAWGAIGSLVFDEVGLAWEILEGDGRVTARVVSAVVSLSVADRRRIAEERIQAYVDELGLKGMTVAEAESAGVRRALRVARISSSDALVGERREELLKGGALEPTDDPRVLQAKDGSDGVVGVALLLLGCVLLTGCQGWLHGSELALHGPDARIERNHRAGHRAVIDILEADYAAAADANVVDPKTGQVTRANLEKQFRLLRFKALQIKVIDRMLREAAAYNGVDLKGKAGEVRSEAGDRAAKLRGYIEDIAKEQGKGLADEVLDSLKGGDE